LEKKIHNLDVDTGAITETKNKFRGPKDLKDYIMFYSRVDQQYNKNVDQHNCCRKRKDKIDASTGIPESLNNL
jgi:hypothetical protein